ncbi:MAG: protein-glutamate O-methyltransferase CheR [Pseudomonadota bacterium]
MNPSNFTWLAAFLKSKSGLILSNDKQYLIDTRLTPIVRANGLNDLDGLVTALKRGSSALEKNVIEAMTTNETFFFRDKTPFDNLSEEILPVLLKNRANRRLRIWCAAASSGQEPYSIAMTIREMGQATAGWTFEIVGTDISTEVLEKAEKGQYSQFEVQRGLPVQHLLKYFTQKGETWEIDAGLRRMVRYKQMNLLDNLSSLGKFDIIFCRNVLIYFDRETKSEILSRVHAMMAPDGYLLLGAAETVVGITDKFVPSSGRRGLYTRSDAGEKPVATPHLKLAVG